MKASLLFQKVFVNSRSVCFHHTCDVKKKKSLQLQKMTWRLNWWKVWKEKCLSIAMTSCVFWWSHSKVSRRKNNVLYCQSKSREIYIILLRKPDFSLSMPFKPAVNKKWSFPLRISSVNFFSFLRIWSHLLKKPLMENFIFLCCADWFVWSWKTRKYD